MILLFIVGAIILFFVLVLIEAQADYAERVARMKKQRQDKVDTYERAKNKPVYKPYVPKDQRHR